MDQIEEVQCAICSIQVRAALCQPREFVYSMSCAGKNDTPVYDSVKEYYGKVVLKSEDLITNSCTVDRDTFTNEAKEAMKQLHPEVLSKNYGCGAVYPEAVFGCKVLDLGSGAGLDCFVLSKLVGSDGHVTGVDMTQEQLDIACKHINYHSELFGYSEPNVDFRQGYIEKLDDVGLEDETFDIVVSNCVINLSPDKKAVLKEAYRVLKTGGELYFSDIYSNQVVPEAIRSNAMLWGECLAGALDWQELVQITVEIGFAPPILVNSTLYKCNDAHLKDMLAVTGCEDLQFCSATYRLMKISGCQPGESEASSRTNGGVACATVEEKLVTVKYKGTITGHQSSMKLSFHEPFKTDVTVLVPESISRLLQGCSRICSHFDFSCPSHEVTPTTHLIPPLSKFKEVNPFKVASKSMELIPPKNVVCCGDAEPPPPKKACC